MHSTSVETCRSEKNHVRAGCFIGCHTYILHAHHPSTHPPIHPSIRMSMHTRMHSQICISGCTCAYLSVHLYIYI